MAGSAKFGRTVKRRLYRWVEGEIAPKVVGSTPVIVWVYDELSGVRLCRDFVECIQDTEIDGWTLSTDKLWINHSMAEITRDTIEVIHT